MTATMKQVFVMDDSAFALELTRVALAETGLAVSCGRDLRDLERLEGKPVDLVLMDVEMPEAFGDDVVTWLIDRGFDAPVYLLSGLSDDELARRAEECGAKGFISKRLGIDAVIARVHGILGLPVIAPSLSSAPTLLVEEFLSMAHGRLRRAEGALDRGDAAGVAAELHLLVGEASLIGLTEVARAAEEGQAAATAAVGEIPLPQARTMSCRLALATIENGLTAVAHRARVPVVSGKTATPCRILLLDDSDFYRSTLMALLEDTGYEVVEVRRVAEARHRMREGRFDIAILDQHLDDGHGSDLIPELREFAPNTRLMLLSADPSNALGADRILLKTLPPDELLREIEQLIAKV